MPSFYLRIGLVPCYPPTLFVLPLSTIPHPRRRCVRQYEISTAGSSTRYAKRLLSSGRGGSDIKREKKITEDPAQNKTNKMWGDSVQTSCSSWRHSWHRRFPFTTTTLASLVPCYPVCCPFSAFFHGHFSLIILLLPLLPTLPWSGSVLLLLLFSLSPHSLGHHQRQMRGAAC